MHTKINKESLVQRATGGDRAALEETLAGVQDLVFNLSLRMLGTFHDAEDASQDILVKVMTRLSSFRGESAFDTWVFRIAVNHLRDYKKHLFAQSPLSFEFYGEDIRSGRASDVPDLTGGVDSSLLARELKLSCTNAAAEVFRAMKPFNDFLNRALDGFRMPADGGPHIRRQRAVYHRLPAAAFHAISSVSVFTPITGS